MPARWAWAGRPVLSSWHEGDINRYNMRLATGVRGKTPWEGPTAASKQLGVFLCLLLAAAPYSSRCTAHRTESGPSPVKSQFPHHLNDADGAVAGVGAVGLEIGASVCTHDDTCEHCNSLQSWYGDAQALPRRVPLIPHLPVIVWLPHGVQLVLHFNRLH